MYGRRHLQFMKVSNQEVEIRVHYSQQDNWIIPAPTLVRAGEGEEGWEKTGHLLMHESQASVLILVVPFFFLWVSFTVPSMCHNSFNVVHVWLCNYLKADPHVTTSESLLRKQLTDYPQGKWTRNKKLSSWQSTVFTLQRLPPVSP